MATRSACWRRDTKTFLSINSGDEIKILHTPSLGFSTVDRAVPSTPFTWGFDSSAEGLSRTEPGFATNTLVGRLDLSPRLALPLHFGGWAFRPEIAVRDTYYTQQLQPTPDGTVGNPVDRDLNRRDLELLLDFRPPPLMRVFDRPLLGRQIKHVVETYAAYNRVAGVDNFQNIIRFDARDILSDTNEVEFGLINRIYGKRSLPKGEAVCQPQRPVFKPGVLGGTPVEPLPGAAIVVPKCEDQGTDYPRTAHLGGQAAALFRPDFRQCHRSRTTQCRDQQRRVYRLRLPYRAAELVSDRLQAARYANPQHRCSMGT